MSRYEGKRTETKRRSATKDLGDPFQDSNSTRCPTATRASRKQATPIATMWERVSQWYGELSKKSRILVLSVWGLVAVLLVGFIGLKLWMRPPELFPKGEQTDAEQLSDGQFPEETLTQPVISGERKQQFYTFLLVGTDMDDGNTDTIMVVSYDTENQKLSVMSIPRDTMINASWDVKKINSVYSRGAGMEGLSQEVSKLIGFYPDYYIKVNLEMFVELVDLVGGVAFDVPQDMDYEDPYQDLYIHLKKGYQTLDGEKSMQLVRFRRYADGDIQRISVQQDFLKALISQCLSLKNWTKISSYIELALKNVTTNLEYSGVAWLVANVLGFNHAPALDLSSIYTCTLPANYYASAYSRSMNVEGLSYVTPYPKEIVEVVNQYFNPFEELVTVDMLDAMTILANGDIASSTGILKDTKHNQIMEERRQAEEVADPTEDETGEQPIETPDPIEGEQPIETPEPVEGEQPTETEEPTDVTQPTETEEPTETPVEGEQSAETEQPIEAPIETETPTESDTTAP